MASNSGFTHLLPSGQSQVNTADDEFRSIKSFMKEWWEQEHYATDGSATSAGIAKHGAGRAFVGTASQLSNPTADNDGRLFFVTDDNVLRIGNVSTSSWSVVADNVTLGSNNSWTGVNEFSGGIIGSSGETLAGARAYFNFSTSNVASSTSQAGSVSGTPQAYELAGAYIVPRNGSVTALSMRTSSGPITAGTLRMTAAIGGTISAFSVEMTSASGAGVSDTTDVGLYTFSANDLIEVYFDGDGSLLPSGTMDVTAAVVEVTYVD